jgi:hypothetical protein
MIHAHNTCNTTGNELSRMLGYVNIITK